MGGDALEKFARKLSSSGSGSAEAIPAATVVLLRDSDRGLETLMLRKNSKIAFGGMWVFPGGRIDAVDGSGGDSVDDWARYAAVREAEEEAAIRLDPRELVWFSHWTPPPLGNRRFVTWFFAARAPEQTVRIDDREIIDSRWMRPADALEQQKEGKIEVVPPTYVTLHHFSRYPDVDSALAAFAASRPRYYSTRVGSLGDELVAMWEGDAGYQSGRADTPGARHRLHMAAGGWRFEESE